MSKQAELRLTAERYRDRDGREMTQVTAQCPCGRGGWIRLDKHPDIITHQKQLLEELLRDLPEKKKDTTAEDLRAGTFTRGDDRYRTGYNEAVREVSALIEKKLTAIKELGED